MEAKYVANFGSIGIIKKAAPLFDTFQGLNDDGRAQWC